MKISIITVCLNSEKTIEQTIRSVLGQKDEDFEYIIVDGCSSDNTLDIVGKYSKDITRIVSEQDGGIYDAMNKGIALATGEIIGIINSDDWYEEGALEAVRKCFQAVNAEVVYGRMNVVNENEEVSTLIPTDIRKIRYEMEIPHPTVFIKREVYDKYGYFQLKYKIASDYELLLRFYSRGVKFFYLDKVLANFRLGGVSQREERKCVLETVTISKQYLHFILPAERKYFENIITYRWRVAWFIEILDNYSFEIVNILEMKLGKGFKDEIAIFGAGNWGTKIYYALIQRGFSPVFFVDNNKEKWNTKNCGIKVLKPEILQTFKGVLLVIVKDFSAKILSQVKNMSNSEVNCIFWEEIVDAFV